MTASETRFGNHGWHQEGFLFTGCGAIGAKGEGQTLKKNHRDRCALWHADVVTRNGPCWSRKEQLAWREFVFYSDKDFVMNLNVHSGPWSIQCVTQKKKTSVHSHWLWKCGLRLSDDQWRMPTLHLLRNRKKTFFFWFASEALTRQPNQIVTVVRLSCAQRGSLPLQTEVKRPIKSLFQPENIMSVPDSVLLGRWRLGLGFGNVQKASRSIPSLLLLQHTEIFLCFVLREIFF